MHKNLQLYIFYNFIQYIFFNRFQTEMTSQQCPTDKKISITTCQSSGGSDQESIEIQIPIKKKFTNFEIIMQNNKQWAQKCTRLQPDYFTKLVNTQTPKYLWIGCADSRVPANQIMGLKPGEVFVHRNVANVASPSDINAQAVIQYAVEYLGVEDIIVSGHYGCGGIRAAFQQNDFGPLESWLSHMRQLRSKYRESLIGSQEQKENTLVQLNVRQQVINVSRVPVVQRAWQRGKRLVIHGVVYNLQDGILKDLGLTTYEIEHVQEEYRLMVAQKLKVN